MTATQVSARVAAPARARKPAIPCPGPGKARHCVGQAEVREFDVALQRAIAEQHVEELAGVAADGGGAEPDLDLEDPRRDLADRRDFADDLAGDVIVAHGRERRLDALLERDRLRARLDRGGVAADTVDGDDPQPSALLSAPLSGRRAGLASLPMRRSARV